MIGKFNSKADRLLWSVTLNGLADSEVTGPDGYYARVGKHILHEDEQGFIVKQTYWTTHDAEVAIQNLAQFPQD